MPAEKQHCHHVAMRGVEGNRVIGGDKQGGYTWLLLFGVLPCC
jgi:hypothetical protein